MQQPDQPAPWTIGKNRSGIRQFAASLCVAVVISTAAVAPAVTLAQAPMPDYATLVEEQGQVVVKITARKTSVSRDQNSQRAQPQLPDELRRYFEQLPRNPGAPRGERGRPGAGFGSGFVVSDDGYIVTNHHVIDGADEIEVSLQDRTVYAAELVGSDPRTDLALLKIDAEGLPAAALGDADSLKVGQWVLAIGSPFGFDYTATQGIISALSRSLPSNDSSYVPFIQTDVAVNPGNSGGPLFDLDGRVVGVNSQIYTRSGGYMGLSFAIPVDVVKNVVGQLRETGTVRRGWLGVSIQPLSRELAQSFGLDRPRGALVAEVTADSPAARAGMLAGDVILRFAGKDIAGAAELPAIVGATPVHSAVEVEVQREGQAQTLTVTLGELAEAGREAPPGQSSAAVAGLTLQPLSPQQRRDAGVDAGLRVQAVEAGSAGARAGLRSGDILLSLNRQPLRTAADFRTHYGSAEDGRPLPLLVARGDGRLYLALPTDE